MTFYHVSKAGDCKSYGTSEYSIYTHKSGIPDQKSTV